MREEGGGGGVARTEAPSHCGCTRRDHVVMGSNTSCMIRSHSGFMCHFYDKNCRAKKKKRSDEVALRRQNQMMVVTQGIA